MSTENGSQSSLDGQQGKQLVEVAYARPDHQVILEVYVPPGATAEEAIRASGMLERFPEIDLTQQKIGIFSKVVPLSQELVERDRVEIYRKLIADPKAARRNRAQKQGAGPGKAGKRSGDKPAPQAEQATEGESPG